MAVKDKVLIFDDEPAVLDLLKFTLEKEGYGVKTSDKTHKAVEIAMAYKPSVVILDVSMLHQDGIETCLQLRRHPELSEVYILFLTDRQEEYTEVAAFESGADDYLIKPVKPRAFISRINTIFERRSMLPRSEEKILVGPLMIDKSAYSVKLSGKERPLSKKEFDILYFLASHPNHVFSREHLISMIWGEYIYIMPRTIDVHIRKIREKIGEASIRTIKGVGYKFDLA